MQKANEYVNQTGIIPNSKTQEQVNPHVQKETISLHMERK